MLTAEKPSIANRIWETLKNFVKKITGVKSTEADRIRKVEGLFRKALEGAKGKTSDPNGVVQYAMKDASGNELVVNEDELNQNKEFVANMAAITSLKGNPFAKSIDKDFITMAYEYLGDEGIDAVNPRIGIVNIVMARMDIMLMMR